MTFSTFVHNSLNLKLTAMSLAHLKYPPKSLSSIATTCRWFHNSYPRTYNKIRLRGFALSCSASSSSLSSSFSVDVRRNRSVSSSFTLPQFYQQNLGYGRFAYDEYASEVESDSECTSSSKQLCGSALDNVEEWRWKLTMLMRHEDELEVVSNKKKDRRDFEQLLVLATRMGLHCRQYEKVVVFSKVPLPNYRSDLDTKRPQREVVLPFGLLREVDSYLKKHLSRKVMTNENFHKAFPASNVGQSSLFDERFDEKEEPSTKSVIAERIIQQRSLEMLNKLQDWQDSPQGQRMLEFRKVFLRIKKERHYCRPSSKIRNF